MLARIRADTESALARGLTPLFVDCSKNEDSLQVLRGDANCVILDAKKMHWEYQVKKFSVEEVLEHCRALLVFAMRRGRTLVVRLNSCSTDFLGTLNDDACPATAGNTQRAWFPLDLFRNCGQVAVTDSNLCDRLHRREEREPKGKGPSFCEPGFRLIVTTTLDPGAVHEMLFNGSFGLPSAECFDVIALQ
jgi:hypothetical protein